MPRIKFKQTVLRAASAFAQHGYQLSEPQPASRAVQFSKQPATGVGCYIEFDLKDWPTLTGREFDVILWRSRLLGFPANDPRYERLNIGLSDLMWYVYGRENVPHIKYWEFTDEQSLHDQIVRTQSLVIDYGIPWLENPESTDPWQIPTMERDTFRYTLTTVVVKELALHGYRPQDIAAVDLPLFIKPLPNGLNAMVEFRQRRFLKPPSFVIDVCLYRKLVDNPYEDQIPNFPGWINNRLDTLLRLKFGVGPAMSIDQRALSRTGLDSQVGEQDSASPVFYWQYTDPLGLQRCVIDILDKLKRYALPWLEDPNSKDLWPALNKR